MVCTHSNTTGDSVLHSLEISFGKSVINLLHGCSSSHQMTHKAWGSEHTSAVQSGPESSESETSEYSDVLFLSSDFTLVKIPEEEFVKKRKDENQSFKLWGKEKR